MRKPIVVGLVFAVASSCSNKTPDSKVEPARSSQVTDATTSDKQDDHLADAGADADADAHSRAKREEQQQLDERAARCLRDFSQAVDKVCGCQRAGPPAAVSACAKAAYVDIDACEKMLPPRTPDGRKDYDWSVAQLKACASNAPGRTPAGQQAPSSR